MSLIKQGYNIMADCSTFDLLNPHIKTLCINRIKTTYIFF